MCHEHFTIQRSCESTRVFHLHSECWKNEVENTHFYYFLDIPIFTLCINNRKGLFRRRVSSEILLQANVKYTILKKWYISMLFKKFQNVNTLTRCGCCLLVYNHIKTIIFFLQFYEYHIDNIKRVFYRVLVTLMLYCYFHIQWILNHLLKCSVDKLARIQIALKQSWNGFITVYVLYIIFIILS